MSIEGLGKKFQEARKSRNLSLEEAERLTRIRQSRLAEIEADDFANFPSLAYAKGFLQIYGKFLDVDVSPYLDAFETSGRITVDGYSYLQDNPAPKPARTHVVRREPSRTSLLPLLIGLAILFFGFWFMRFILNVQRISPHPTEAAATPTPAATVATTAIVAPRAQPVESSPRVATTTVAPRAQPVESPPRVATTPIAPRAQPVETPRIATTIVAPRAQPVESPPRVVATATPSTTTRQIVPAPTAIAIATPVLPTPRAVEPEVRRAEAVRPDEVAAAEAESSAADSAGPNRVDIRPLKKTYVQVTIDDDSTKPAFERWVSPSDGVVEFRGHRFNVRVLDREAIQIRKNGKIVANSDADLQIE